MKRLIAFFEIPTADFSRAVEFYETVLNVALPIVECEDEKWLSSLKTVRQLAPFPTPSISIRLLMEY